MSKTNTTQNNAQNNINNRKTPNPLIFVVAICLITIVVIVGITVLVKNTRKKTAIPVNPIVEKEAKKKDSINLSEMSNDFVIYNNTIYNLIDNAFIDKQELGNDIGVVSKLSMIEPGVAEKTNKTGRGAVVGNKCYETNIDGVIATGADDDAFGSYIYISENSNVLEDLKRDDILIAKYAVVTGNADEDPNVSTYYSPAKISQITPKNVDYNIGVILQLKNNVKYIVPGCQKEKEIILYNDINKKYYKIHQ